MTKTDMTVRVSDQHLTLVNVPLIASGGVDEVRIHFQFCGLWDGCGKTAVFYRDPDEVYHVPIADGSAIAPHEVLTEEGFFYLGVMGTADNIRTTEVVRLYVAQGAITTATANHEELTPDIYQQLLAAYGKAEAAITREVETREAEIAVERARLDNLVATRPQWGPAAFDFAEELETLPLKGTITIDGIVAHVDVQLLQAVTVTETSPLSYTVWLPDNLAPKVDTVLFPDPRLSIAIYVAEGSSPAGDVTGQTMVTIRFTEPGNYGPFTFHGTYPLAAVTIAEIEDIRVDHKGETHPTAGAAVRALGVRADEIAGLVETLCPEFSASGAAVRCEAVKGYPLKVRSYFEAKTPGDDGTIEPYDEFAISLFIEGKNIYNPEEYLLTPGQYVQSNGKLMGYSPDSKYACTKGFIYVGHLRGQQITLNHPPAETGGSGPRMNFYTARDEASVIANASTNAHTATVPDNAQYMRFSCPRIYADGSQIQIELGSMVTSYEPYREPEIFNESLRIQSQNPMYAGYFDWDTGCLYSTHDLVEGLPETLTEKTTPECLDTFPTPTITAPGSSIIYSSTGDTEVSGRANPGALIDILTRRLETMSATATVPVAEVGGMAL